MWCATSRREALAAMTKQQTVDRAGAAGTDPSAAATGLDDGQVSRSVILQAALRIIDRDGIDGLSMRRLSEEVGRDPTVLYRHIPSKAALLDGVAEIVLGQLRVDTADPDWAGQLRTVAHDLRRLRRGGCAAHLPGAVRVPARPHPHRVAGGHRATRGDRRCAAPWPAPAGG